MMNIIFESLICKDAKDPMTNAFRWTERAVMTAGIKTRAKRALEILLETERKMHDSRLNYY